MRVGLRKLFPLLLITISGYGQINLETIKGVANSELGRKVKEGLLSNLDRMRGDYDEASFNYAVALTDNAGLFESEERFKKNRRILLDAFAASQGRDVNNQDKAVSLNSIGEMMYASGKYSSAETSFRQAQKQLEDVQDSSGLLYAQILSNMGLLYHTTGRYTIAEKLTLKAKEIRKRKTGEHTALFASSLNNQAVLYKDLGRYTEAEELIGKAVLLAQSTAGKESVPYALSLNNQAMILFAVGRSEEAEKLLNEALAVAGKTLKEKSSNYVRLLINLAVMKQDLGEFQEAETIFLKAIKIKERQLNTRHPDYAHLLNHLASLYLMMGKSREVENNLKQAAEIYKKKLGEIHPAYAGTIHNLGNFYRVNRRYTEAENLLKSAMTIRRESLGEKHPDYVNSLESLGLLHWKTGNQAEASRLLRDASDKRIEFINHYFASMSDAEKAKLWQKTRPGFQHFYDFAASTGKSNLVLLQDMYNYQLATKALLLNTSTNVRRQITKSKDKTLKAKYTAWLDLKEELAHAYTLSKQELKEEKINPDSIERVANKLEKELSTSSALFSKGFAPRVVKAPEISKALNADEAAVEIIQLHRSGNQADSIYYVALILTRESAGKPEMVVFNNGNELNKKYLKYYRNCIQHKLKDEYSFTQYWKPLHESVKARKIYVSLDGVYNQLNINTFLLPDGKFVLDQKEIVVVTNTREILRIKKPEAAEGANTALLVGFPDYGSKGTITKLPGTQKELDNVNKALQARRYKTRYLIKAHATEDKVKDTESAGIVHFATHGFFIPEPDKETSHEMLFGISSERALKDPLLRAGLLLAGAEKAIEGKTEDGILTAFEVSNMSLPETEIVILSACETGLGDVKNGEGVYGLQRAFQVAGANSVIMSLWKVDDEATQQLMGNFYKHYLQSKDKYKAFRKAQSELKARYREPLYWGAFVLVE